MKRWDGTEMRDAAWNSRVHARCSKCNRLGEREDFVRGGPADKRGEDGWVIYPFICRNGCKPVNEEHLKNGKPPVEAKIVPPYLSDREPKLKARGLDAKAYAQVGTIKAKIAEVKKDIERLKKSYKATRKYVQKEASRHAVSADRKVRQRK